MIACIRLMHWVAAIERQRDPLLIDVPLVIGGHAWESSPVLAVSAEAYEASVRVGMPLKQAWALCPGARFLRPDEAGYLQAYDAMLDLLWIFSDQVEPPAEPFATSTSDFYLDLGRLHDADVYRLAGKIQRAIMDHFAISARIGLAFSKFSACAAAVYGENDIALIPGGQEAAFLSSLPVSMLPLDAKQAHRLALLGIQTLGQFASLPARTMLTQFGIQGPLLHRLARGEDHRAVAAVPCPQTETLAHECEPPIEDYQLLQGVISHMSTQLVSRLAVLGMACPELQLVIELRRGETVSVQHQPREAVHTARELNGLLLRLLDQQVLTGSVYGITIHLRHLQVVQAHQLSLFEIDPDSRQMPSEVLERLSARHGRELFCQIQRVERPTSAYLPEQYRLASVVA